MTTVADVGEGEFEVHTQDSLQPVDHITLAVFLVKAALVMLSLAFGLNPWFIGVVSFLCVALLYHVAPKIAGQPNELPFIAIYSLFGVFEGMAVFIFSIVLSSRMDWQWNIGPYFMGQLIMLAVFYGVKLVRWIARMRHPNTLPAA
ncbi:MAG: hypothetical protein AAB443_04130 [Patescibacteria group bacterium]